MSFFTNIFKSKGKEQIATYIKNGALIIDVRTPNEFKSGHIEGSKNYNLSEIRNNLKAIKKMNKPIVVCCASGIRSAQAKTILSSVEIDVINGGGWRSLKKYV